MKLLVVAPHPFFSFRGTPFSVYYRALVMAEQGVSIDLLTYGDGEDVDIEGMRIVRIPIIPFLDPIPVGPSWKKLVLDSLMILWTIALLLRHRYDAVHAHEEAVFWCRLLKPVFRFRLIYDMHSSLPQQLENFKFTKSPLLLKTFRRLEDTCLHAADAVITICPELRDYALEAGVDPARLLLIENSIFDEVKLKRGAAGAQCGEPPVEIDHERPLVLYAGTFEAYQGVEMLAEAFAEVRRSRPDAQLLLVGGMSAQVEAIRALADSLGLGSSCVVTGRVGKAEVLKYTRAAQVLVSPRLHGTNTPLKIYEQLASGKALVATRISSHTQILDDSVCYLVDPDAASLAAGIVAALSDSAQRALRTDNARALYERNYSRPVYEGRIRRLLEILA